MSDQAVSLPLTQGPQVEPKRVSAKSFVWHAKLIGAITFISRILGMARESIAANYFGAGAIWSAFTVAFTIPNLFRKLFGEGALSAAFIPLYAQAIKREELGDQSGEVTAADFAVASVNLLCGILIALTIVGELVLVALLFVRMRPDYLLAVKLTIIMLPYVLMICGTAFLGAILQVHHRFVAITATSIVSNLCLIIAIVVAAKSFDLKTEAGQEYGVRWLAISVLIAGVIQVLMLMPSLRAVGFRFRLILHLWTPAIRKMLWMTLPVALGAGVMQISVVLDKGISFLLAEADGHSTFTLLGHVIKYPMAEGAAARLNWAQFMYQFPLGVFAIALATAIFPKLSSDALDTSKATHSTSTALGTGAAPGGIQIPEDFKRILRQGVEASLFIGLPASIGMIVVRYPAIRFLFQRGNFTSADTYWVALSTAIYSAAIWAFSLQQILNRAYYALHDTMTPLIWGIVNLAINTIIEIPLLWTPLRESGMAVGTLVSFAIQAVIMLWMLDRRVGGLHLRQSLSAIAKMILASAAMWLACVAIQHTPVYPSGETKLTWAIQLGELMTVGGGVYFALCAMMGMNAMKSILPRRLANRLS
jgi:putative peptidoglycan lipid II flippase